jgi:hypothetical protein
VFLHFCNFAILHFRNFAFWRFRVVSICFFPVAIDDLYAFFCRHIEQRIPVITPIFLLPKLRP